MGQLFPGVLLRRNAIFCMPVNAPETKNLPGHKSQQQTDKYPDEHSEDWIRVQKENLIYGSGITEHVNYQGITES